MNYQLLVNCNKVQMKNHGYASYDMVMNLAQTMLTGRSLEAFLNERRVQEAKNKTRKANEQTLHTTQQIYDCAIFGRQSVILTSKVDGEMPMRGRENTRQEIFSWENSTQKSSVKNCKI
jgi:hypothetical protein